MANPPTNDLLALMAAEPWAMEPTRLQALFARLSSLGPALAAVARIEIEPAPAKLRVSDGVAHVPVKGLLLTAVPGWLRFFGIDATAYGDITGLVNQAVGDPVVTSIQLDVDSPGGTVAGVLGTARAIRAARQAKPVTAVVENLAASAAYWLASQAARISADLNAEIGSIGVYTVYHDMTKMADDLGIKVQVIRSGVHKGMGIPGAPISDAQIAAMQEVIDGIAENFISAVAEGRGMEPDEARALATGRLWEAKAALPLQLIDTLGPTGGSGTAGTSSKSESQGDPIMSEEIKEQAAAESERQKIEAQERGAAAERTRLAEFKAAFAADLEFAVTAYESGLTLDQAKSQHTLMSRRAEAAQKTEKAATGADGRIGAQGAEGNEGGGDDGKEFLEQARARAHAQGISRTEAMKRLAAEKPQLYEAFRAAEMRRPILSK